MVAPLFCADSIAAVFKGSLNPDPALLGTIIAHPLATTCVVATICEIIEVSSFIRSKCRWSQYFKIRPLDLTTPVSGYFVMCEIGCCQNLLG